MKIYTYKAFNQCEASLIEKFLNGDKEPETYDIKTDRIQEDCLIMIHVIDLLHDIPYDVLARISYVQKKKILLVYHHKNLGVRNFDQTMQLIAIRQILEQMNFTENQVYFICQLKGDIPLIKEHLGNINIMHFCKWMDEFKDNQVLTILKRLPGRNIQLFPNLEYKKMSVCIRRFEQDRLNFMTKLVDEGLMDDFNFSFTNHLGTNCRDTISIDEIKTMLPNNIVNKEKVNKFIDNMPYIYGNDIEFPYPLELDSLIVNSFVNVAFETSPRNDTCVISEKVYKPMFLMKPFILISQPYGLQLLRDSGFMTFGDFIDESYDKILDFDERMQAILLEIKKIQNMPLRAISEAEHNMIGIFVHNFQLLVSEMFKPFPEKFTYRGIMND